MLMWISQLTTLSHSIQRGTIETILSVKHWVCHSIFAQQHQHNKQSACFIWFCFHFACEVHREKQKHRCYLHPSDTMSRPVSERSVFPCRSSLVTVFKLVLSKVRAKEEHGTNKSASFFWLNFQDLIEDWHTKENLRKMLILEPHITLTSAHPTMHLHRKYRHNVDNMHNIYFQLQYVGFAK